MNNSFTKEQLMNENLKNNEGESNLEVRKRMISVISQILKDNYNKRIVIVSHGAAIKYYLQNFCKFDSLNDVFYFNGKEVCQFNLESPSVLKMKFENNLLKDIEKLDTITNK